MNFFGSYIAMWCICSLIMLGAVSVDNDFMRSAAMKNRFLGIVQIQEEPSTFWTKMAVVIMGPISIGALLAINVCVTDYNAQILNGRLKVPEE